MPSHKQGTTSKHPENQGNYPGGIEGSQPSRLREMFRTPVGDGTDYDIHNDEGLRNDLIALLRDGVVNDAGHTLGTFDRDFSAGADILPENIATGPGGLPGTAFTPNTASPGAGNGTNPADLPEPPPIPETSGGGFPGGPGATLPGETIPSMGAVPIGSLVMGKSYIGSDGS